MHGMTDSVMSCWMYISSSALTLITYMGLNKQFLTFAGIIVLQAALYHAVTNVFSAGITDLILIVLNLLACVLMALDQLDKVLATRDASFVSYLMNSLNAIACLVWGAYYQREGSP